MPEMAAVEIPVDNRADEFELHRLADGRKLAWLEWGAASGFPVFYFHGTPSSRLEGAFADSAARQHGLRLIAIDRPGFGRSTFQVGRRFSDWPADVLSLAGHLKLREFGIAGHSGAGPHLFACGGLIDPGRLRFIGALAPWGPVAAAHIQQGLSALDRRFFQLAQRLPWLIRVAFAPIGWSARFWPSLFFSIMRRSVSPADQAAMGNDALITAFRHTEREAFRQGSRGAAHEAGIAYRPWDIELSAVRVPTFIWKGEQDVFVSKPMGEHLRQQIPNVEYHTIPAEGHFHIHRWDDIFQACCKHIP